MAGWNVLEQNWFSDAELAGDRGGKVVESGMSVVPVPVRALIRLLDSSLKHENCHHLLLTPVWKTKENQKNIEMEAEISQVFDTDFPVQFRFQYISVTMSFLLK